MTTERSGMSFRDEFKEWAGRRGWDCSEASDMNGKLSFIDDTTNAIWAGWHGRACKDFTVNLSRDAVVSESDAIGLIDGLNMMANSSDATGHNSEAEFLRCCAHAIHQSFFERHAAVPDGYVLVPVEPTEAMVSAGACQISMRDSDTQGAVACWERMIANAPEAMLAQRDGGKE